MHRHHMKPKQTDANELDAVRVQRKRIEYTEDIRYGLAKIDHNMRVTIPMGDRLYMALHREARENNRTVAEEARRILNEYFRGTT